jgi:hypothetical protein
MRVASTAMLMIDAVGMLPRSPRYQPISSCHNDSEIDMVVHGAGVAAGFDHTIGRYTLPTVRGVPSSGCY